MDNIITAYYLIIVAVWLAFGLGGAFIMSGKGRTGLGGFTLGALLGPIGLILAMLIRPSIEHEANRQVRIEEARHRIDSPRQQRETPLRSYLQPKNEIVLLSDRMSMEVGQHYVRWHCIGCAAIGPWMDNSEIARSAEEHVCVESVR